MPGFITPAAPAKFNMVLKRAAFRLDGGKGPRDLVPLLSPGSTVSGSLSSLWTSQGKNLTGKGFKPARLSVCMEALG